MTQALDMTKDVEELDLEAKLLQIRQKKPKPETEEQYYNRFMKGY